MGAGDYLGIGIAWDTLDSTGTAGYFNNQGNIFVEGAADNYAVAKVKIGNASNNFTSGSRAHYGNVYLSFGDFYAFAPNFEPNSSGNFIPSNFTLSNASTLVVLNSLNQTWVQFDAKTNNSTVLLGETAIGSGGSYNFFGTISGFTTGDTIGLLQASSGGLTGAAPASLGYDSLNRNLLIYDAANTQIGTIHLNGTYTAKNFVLSAPRAVSGEIAAETAGSTTTYLSQYNITFNDVPITYNWVSGATGSIYTASDWDSGVIPYNTTATLGVGEIDVLDGSSTPTGLTLNAGTLVTGGFAATPQSILAVGNVNLQNDFTLNVTGTGGSFPRPRPPGMSTRPPSWSPLTPRPTRRSMSAPATCSR